MKALTTNAEIEHVLTINAAVLVLFGGAHCGVCQAIKAPLENLIGDEFPQMVSVYVDCEQNSGQACASRGIFTLPVVQIWFEGQRFGEFVRVFSLGDIRTSIERPYRALFAEPDQQSKNRSN